MVLVNTIGFPTNKLTSWSVVEDYVSLDRNNSTGGFSEYSLAGTGFVEAADVIGHVVMLDDPRLGRTHAFVRAITNTPWAWSATLNDPFYQLNVETTIPSLYRASVKDIVKHFFKCAGSTEPKIFTAASRNSSMSFFKYGVPGIRGEQSIDQFNFPGAKGNLWNILKSFLSAKDWQITWVYDTIVLYRNHSVLTRFQGFTRDYSIDFSVEEPFSDIECTYYEEDTLRRHYYYSAEYPSGTTPQGRPVVPGERLIVLAYPPTTIDGDNRKELSSGEVLSVESGETKEFILEVNGVVNALYDQPVCVMPKDIHPTDINISTESPGTRERHIVNKSKYCVVGKDNKPITPAQWYAEGGSVSVELGDEPNQLKVRVTGMDNQRLAPFRLAESDGQNDYQSLRILADAYLYKEKTLNFQTGYTTKTEPVKIDSKFIASLDEAYEACVYAAQKAFGYICGLDWTGAIPLNEAYTDVVYDFERELITAADVTAFTGAPLPEKAAEKWPSGTTMYKIDTDLLRFTDNKPVTNRAQVFGRLSGTCAVFDRFVWTIASVNYDDSGVKAVCEPYTKVVDLAAVFDRPKVKDLVTPKGITLRELSLKGYTHNEA